MARPMWQIEVPMSYLTLEERAEVDEKLSNPLNPEEALEMIEEVAEHYDFEIAFKMRGMHLSGVRITLDLASQMSTEEKEDE